MNKKTTIILFFFFLLFEIVLWWTGYTHTYFLTKFIIRTFILIMAFSLVYKSLKKMPKQVIIALSVVLTISFVIFFALTFSLVPIILGFSGSSRRDIYWNNNKYIIENKRGQDWAGPPYNNFTLYKKKLIGLIKKEIAMTTENPATDSCYQLEFQTYFKNDTTIYRYKNCDKEIVIINK